MTRVLVLVVTLAGCDAVFGFPDRASPAGEGGLDGANGHDEDGDRIVDGEDPCPSDKGDRADGDNDSVGDLCDPDSATVEHRVLFDPFTSETGGWTGAGTWSYGGDSVTTVASAGTPSELHLPVGSVTHATGEITLSVTPGLYSFSGLGLTIGGVQLKCFLFVNAAGVAAISLYRDASYEGQVAWSGLTPTHMYLTHLPDGKIRCRVRADGQAPVDVRYETSFAGTTTTLSLFADNSSIVVSSAELVETP